MDDEILLKMEQRREKYDYLIYLCGQLCIKEGEAALDEVITFVNEKLAGESNPAARV